MIEVWSLLQTRLVKRNREVKVTADHGGTHLAGLQHCPWKPDDWSITENQRNKLTFFVQSHALQRPCFGMSTGICKRKLVYDGDHAENLVNSSRMSLIRGLSFVGALITESVVNNV